jgi:hypothetical protein
MPKFVPCSVCGITMDRGSGLAHRCDTARLLDECMAAMRGEVDLLEPQLHRWLSTAEGRRDAWWAAREVRRRP